MSSQRLALAAEKREETGNKLTALRRAGFVPGIVYGYKVQNTMVKVDTGRFLRVFREGGENTLVDLDVEGNKKPYTVLIHDVAFDPVKATPVHVDFFAVNLQEKVKTEVPLKIVGISPAVNELDGTLVNTIHSVEVESLPTDIPHEIEVDVSPLKTFEDRITVGDLSAGEGAEILADADDVVALVEAPRTAEELEELEEEVREDVEDVEGVAKEGEEETEGEKERAEAEASGGAKQRAQEQKKSGGKGDSKKEE